VRRLLPILGLVVLASVVVAISAIGGTPYNSDALFYEAQVEELEGASHARSLDEWFHGPEAREAARREDRPEHLVRVLDPNWPDYADQFYRRRWVVQEIGAAADTVVSEHDRLLVASWLGYLLIGPLIFLLLRVRFSALASFVVAAACLLLPPVVEHSTLRGVDSWGLALTIASLLFLALAATRGLRWLPAFVVAMALLSITRDNTLVPLAAAFWLAWVARRDLAVRARHIALAGAGLLAAVPALILGGAPLREQLAWVLNNFEVPADSSWGWVLPRLPEALAKNAYYDLRYVTEHAFTPLVVPLLVLMLAALGAAAWWLIFRTPREDPYFRMMRASLVGGLVLVALAASYQALRIEIVMVPALAVGAAHWLDTRLAAWRAAPKRAASGATRPASRSVSTP
jgi:hypothetical protein